MSNQKKKKVLTADELTGLGPQAYEEVDLTEELGGVIYIRPVKAGEVMRFLDLPEEKRAEKMSEVIARVIVDDSGEQVFSEDQADQLKEMRMDVYNKITMQVMDKFRQEPDEGNLQTAGGGDSPTA